MKDERSLKRAKEWDTNRVLLPLAQSKAHQIYESKKEIKQNTNQFYQSRTGSSLKNYQSRIETFQEYKQHDHEDIRSLEKQLTDLKQKSNDKQEKAMQLSQQLNKIKQETKL